MKKRFKPPPFTTVIGSGTVIFGDLTFSGGLHLDGEIRGDVQADGGSENSTLTVSDQAKILGDVSVANLIVNGSIEGDVHSSSLVELAENARISGEIHYKQLEMAMGAKVDGGLVRLPVIDDQAAASLQNDGRDEEPQSADVKQGREEGKEAANP